jgi:hypothetical protein
MLEIYSYEYVRAANDERRTRALNRYERLYRRVDGTEATSRIGGAEVVEITFANGCPEPDQISA